MKSVFGLVIVACAVMYASGQAATSASGGEANNMAAMMSRMGGMSAMGGMGGMSRGMGGGGGMGGLGSLLGGGGGALLLGGGMDMNNLLPFMMCTRMMSPMMCMMQFMN